MKKIYKKKQIMEDLEFVGSIQKRSDLNPREKVCVVKEGLMTTSTMNMAIEKKTEIEGSFAVDTFEFKRAVSNCSEEIYLKVNKHRLTLKSGKVRMFINIRSTDNISKIKYDRQTDSIKSGKKFLSAVSKGGLFADANHDNPICNTVYCSGRIIQSTDRINAIQAVSPYNLPTMHLSKKIVEVLAKIKLDASGVGVSDNSVTFYDKNGSKVKCLQIECRYPDLNHIVDCSEYSTPVDDIFYDDIKRVSDASGNNLITIGGGSISSEGSIMNVKSETDLSFKEVVLNSSHILKLRNLATDFEFLEGLRPVYFKGKRVRGALARFTVSS